mgnify:CR=1 FL=1
MKLRFITILLSISSIAFAQNNEANIDIIELIDGKTIKAQVTKIAETEVEYINPFNPESPVYSLAKNRIRSIQYNNGFYEEFNATERPSTVNTEIQNQNSSYNTQFPQNSFNQNNNSNSFNNEFERSTPLNFNVILPKIRTSC